MNFNEFSGLYKRAMGAVAVPEGLLKAAAIGDRGEYGLRIGPVLVASCAILVLSGLILYKFRKVR